MDRRTVGVVLVVIASACFGMLAIFGKVATRVGLNTTTLLTYRFVIGTAILWTGLIAWGRGERPSGRPLRVGLSLGVLYAMFSGLFFLGLSYVPAGIAGVTFYTFPLLVYLLSVPVLGERITRHKLVALGVAMAGVMLILVRDPAGVDELGIALILMSAAGYALYIVGSRAALASIAPDVLAGTALIATAAVFLGFGVLSGRLVVPTNDAAWAVIGGIAVFGTAVPLLLYVRGLERVDASHAAVIGTVEPLVTVLLGIALLGESVTLATIGGGVLVVGGVVVIQRDVATERRPAH